MTSGDTFSNIQTAGDLKTLLGLEDEKPLWVAVVDEEKFCAKDGCPYPPMLRNKGRCALHCQQWWPKPGERGHLLLDPEFITPPRKKSEVCCCRDPTCFAVGYSPFGYIEIPKEKQYRKDIVRAMGESLSEEVRSQLLQKTPNGNLFLAPYHFLPAHRRLDYRGKRMVLKTARGGLRDNSGKHYYFPPPSYSVKEFVETELPPALLGHEGIPDWAEFYAAIESTMTMVTPEVMKKSSNGNNNNNTSVDETVAETVVDTDISCQEDAPADHQLAPTPSGNEGLPTRKSAKPTKRRQANTSSQASGTRDALASNDDPMLSLTEPLLAESSDSNNEENCDIAEDYVHIASSDVYAADPQRFIVLVVYCACNLVASAEWITFAPVEDAVRVRYNISSSQVNWLSLIFMAAYGPGTVVATWAIRKFGLRTSVVTSAFLMALGSLMRWASAYLSVHPSSDLAYGVLLGGQGLVAIAQPVFANSPSLVASRWFSETTNAIGFAVFTAMIGMVIGQAMSPLCVTESNGNHLGQLLAGQAFCMVICAIATWWWFKSEPPVPPSPSEAARRQARRNGEGTSATSLWKDICTLATDFQYAIMLISFGIGYGINNALLTLLQPWMEAIGFPGDKIVGLCGSLVIIGGIVGTMIAAPWLNATRNYTRAVRWSFVVQFAVAAVAVATLQPKSSDWVLGFAFTAIGMSQCPLLTICLDAAAAHTYPISEELSSAGLQLVGQYLGVTLTSAMGSLLHSSKGAVGYTAPINVAFLGLLGAATLIAIFYSGDDPRANANANINASAANAGSINANNEEHDEENPE